MKTQKTNYFSWESIFKKYPKYKNCSIQCVLTERNTGKTYSTFEYLKKYGFTKENKVLYLRNTDTELRRSKSDFNARFKDELIVRGDFIYTIKKSKIKEDGEEKIINKVDEHVGYFASINNYINYKSLEAKDIKYIMYEEFNEDTSIGRQIYFKFINIIKTFERFNKLKYIFMLGNKDGFDSDYFVNWNIIPSINPKESIITPINDELGTFGVVYDLGHNEFLTLKNNKTIGNRLAQLDNRTNNYIVGGYLKQHSQRVINYKKILEHLTPKFYLAIGDEKYMFGKCNEFFAILAPWNINQHLEIKAYSFDIMSGLSNGVFILENEEHVELVNYIFMLEKDNKLLYDSYDTKNVIANLIFIHKKHIQKE